MSRETIIASASRSSVGNGFTISKVGPMTRTCLVIGVALLAASCKSIVSEVDVAGHDYRKNHPIIVEEAPAVLDVPVARQTARIDPGLKQAIRLYAEGYKRRHAQVMHILVPSGSGHDAAAVRTARQITKILNQSGVPTSRIHRRPYRSEGGRDAAPIRLAYHRLTARVEQCGNWPDNLAVSPENENWHNYGCASQSNLATLVDNPSDLLYPRGSASGDTARRIRDLDVYRDGSSPATDWKDEDDGFASEVQN
ncbi:CpaD family pilus assembly protein [Coralliovum pocilloporae]|uniref:CpaD family pilus assembly protein n=1 Tax=Coralliovum pocilloporae TaxID=3066369 RepID=UPI0033071E68